MMAAVKRLRNKVRLLKLVERTIPPEEVTIPIKDAEEIIEYFEKKQRES